MHDLIIDARKQNEQRRTIAAVHDSFNTQTNTTLSVIGQSAHEGHNAYAKIATTVIAIGTFAKDKITQIIGRVGRMGAQLGNGEHVPTNYKAVYFHSSFAESLSNIGQRGRAHGVVIPEDILGKVKDLQEALSAERKGNGNDEIEINVQKLIKADEYLQSNGAVAEKYIEALWDFYLAEEDAASNDDAASDGVAELSSADGSDDEPDGEEAEQSDDGADGNEEEQSDDGADGNEEEGEEK